MRLRKVSLDQCRLPLPQLEHELLDRGDEDGVVKLDDVPCLRHRHVRLRLDDYHSAENVCLGLRKVIL